MDSKTIKNTLKQAKEAIKTKDINSALNLCKAVLKEDRNNYIALVLLGAALQESDQKDQAPNAFRKAIEILPDQVLAWQGLAAFYEKDDCNKNAKELVSVYQRLLQLDSETSKWCELVCKIQAIITKFNSDDVVAEIVESHKNTDDNGKLEALRKLVVCYLSQVNKIPQENLSLYESLLNNKSSAIENEYCQVYFKLLYCQNKMQELLDYAETLTEVNCQDRFIQEWVCKVCAERFVDDRSSVINWCSKLPQFYEALLATDEDNVLALMAQGAYFMSQRAYLEARESLQQCLLVNNGLFHALCLMAETNLQLLCLEQAKHYAKSAARLRPDAMVPRAILAKTHALSNDSLDWKSALNETSEILTECNSEIAVEAQCQALLQLKEWSELLSAIKLLSHAPALASLLVLEAEAGSERGKDLLSSLSQETPPCPEAFYRLGQLHLAAGSHDLACRAFLQCAKLAPHWYTAYFQLGHLYAMDGTTRDKARRCYQRALALNPTHLSTQMALSDTYYALGDSERNLELLTNIVERPEGRWAWPRLGLQYSVIGDSTSAVNCLRAALKSDPDNSHLWEALADAYLARGASGSALKSYQKVLELRPGTFYPALQIASIKQIIELPEESLLEFRELANLQPNSMLALKGLCEACLCLAKKFLACRLLGLARDRLQEGLTAISSALQIKPQFACLWKLAGDCLTIAGGLPSSWHELSVPKVLSPKTDCQVLKGAQLLELGARCMCRCLKLMPDTGKALVWHDLALNYRQQVKLSADGEGESGVNTICERALASAKESVLLDPLSWQHWNQLGIVAAMPGIKKYALAQHAFIRATMVDDTVAAPWSNLGCLYLSLNELKLANAAFSAAQPIDSEYCPSWVGQALIAEQVNNDDTMDLFRHTTQLGYNAQSCLGYAQLVCKTLQRSEIKNHPHYIYNVEKMHAVPVAIDGLTWATDEEEDDVCGLNMLGCLLERCGQHRTSVGVLSRAVDQCNVHRPGVSPHPHVDKVLANLARVLLKAGEVDDAIQFYKAITKADIHSQCGLALSLYKGEQYQEAYDAYEAALNWWADDSVKSHLHVAMAAVAYKMTGPDQAKTLLLQGNQSKDPSVHGLFAACSLGMLNGDLELSKLMLKELLTYQNQPEYVPHIALFQAYIKFLQGDIQGSVWSMSKNVHRQPQLAALWLHLALLILHKDMAGSEDKKHQVAVAAQCAHTAMALGRNTMDVSKVLAVVSLSQLLDGDAKRALSASQHAVHLYPAVGESWAVLAASCYAAQSSAPLKMLVSHARQHVDLERPLAKWMSNFDRKIDLLTA